MPWRIGVVFESGRTHQTIYGGAMREGAERYADTEWRARAESHGDAVVIVLRELVNAGGGEVLGDPFYYFPADRVAG